MVHPSYDIAMAAGEDAANRQMQKAGRSKWNDDDWNEAVRVFNLIMGAPPDLIRELSRIAE